MNLEKDRNVVGGVARIHSFDDPQTLLGKGEGKGHAAIRNGQGSATSAGRSPRLRLRNGQRVCLNRRAFHGRTQRKINPEEFPDPDQ